MTFSLVVVVCERPKALSLGRWVAGDPYPGLHPNSRKAGEVLPGEGRSVSRVFALSVIVSFFRFSQATSVATLLGSAAKNQA